MNKRLVSVIIPAYNVERYIEDCLDSIVSQNYNDLEVIVINDGSVDNTSNLVERYTLKYPFIKLYNQENKGQSTARNRGIELAKGEYILFVDSDDYILPNTITELMKKINKDKLDLIRFAAESFVDEGNFIIVKNKYYFGKYFRNDVVYNNKEFNKININAFSPSPVLYLFKKNILMKSDIYFNTNYKMYEDELFTLEVFLNVNRVMYDNRKFYRRRYRENSIMTTANEKSFEMKCSILQELYKIKEKYKKETSKQLIDERIITTNKLLFTDKNVGSNIKKSKIMNINNYGHLKYYKLLYYYTLRNKLRSIKIRLKNRIS